MSMVMDEPVAPAEAEDRHEAVPCLTEAWTQGLIAGRARDLTQHVLFQPNEEDDIRQELTIDLLKRVRRFDGRKARYKLFARCVVNRRVSTLIRYREQAKRAPEDEAGSLNEPVDIGEEEPVDGSALVAEDAHQWRLLRRSNDRGGVGRARSTLTQQDRSDLRLDVQQALDALPDEQRAVAEMFMAGMTQAEVAQRLGAPRESLRDDHMTKLRKSFLRIFAESGKFLRQDRGARGNQ